MKFDRHLKYIELIIKVHTKYARKFELNFPLAWCTFGGFFLLNEQIHMKART